MKFSSKLQRCLSLDPILIARALQDYYPQDCRFIPLRQGQLVYVFAMLKDHGNLFWAGSVSSKINWMMDGVNFMCCLQ